MVGLGKHEVFTDDWLDVVCIQVKVQVQVENDHANGV